MKMIFSDRKAYRLTVYNLAFYSPDYNPIEKLWKKIKEIEFVFNIFQLLIHSRIKCKRRYELTC